MLDWKAWKWLNKRFKWSKTFIECSNTVNDVYENIDDYNPNRKRKDLNVFENIIDDIMSNKKFQAVVKELFIRCGKLNVSLAFITQSYFSVTKICQIKFNTLLNNEDS